MFQISLRTNSVMNNTSAKERILKKIRDALIHTTPEPFPDLEGASEIYKSNHEALEVQFAEQFTKIQGNFIYCEGNTELINSLNTIAAEKKWNKVVCWETELLNILDQNLFSRISSD